MCFAFYCLSITSWLIRRLHIVYTRIQQPRDTNIAALVPLAQPCLFLHIKAEIFRLVDMKSTS